MNLLMGTSLLALSKPRSLTRDYQLILQEDTAPNCIYKINRSITYSHNGKRFIKRCRLQLSSWTLLKGACSVQLWTNSVYLRTKLKFLYLSGSHQLYLLYRNKNRLGLNCQWLPQMALDHIRLGLENNLFSKQNNPIAHLHHALEK